MIEKEDIGPIAAKPAVADGSIDKGSNGDCMMNDILTPLQLSERGALCLDRMEILRVVSALRKYRALMARLINASDPWMIIRCECENLVKEIESVGEYEE